MTENGKRKDAPTTGKDQQRAKKKKAGSNICVHTHHGLVGRTLTMMILQTGNAGKWKTPHQLAKMQHHQDANLQPGDTGIWVTCARHQEGKAAREIEVLFSEYAEKIYGIKPVHGTTPGDGDENDDDTPGGGGVDDLETSIRAEVAALTSKPTATTPKDSASRLTPLKMNVDCLLFVKTHPPINPVAFARRICEDARRCDEIPGLMRCRYVNRLTPGQSEGREEGGEGGRGEVEKGKGEETVVEGQGVVKVGEGNGDAAPVDAALAEKKPYTFAIRPTIRNHSTLKRDVVINTIAGLINEDRHKVNLSSPDKVILVDIHQNVCGMSVVDGNWEDLKRYNLTELYGQGRKSAASGITGEKA
ncbi:hypothetical protein VTJ49DRAFT_4971 [Mycothermus thermophilus]|uniref:THUMP domain-containing protein n=1 Tax=Humicola insolens TaxID=85995 RepID=A0ABR3VQE2_HUMIN